LGTILLLLFGLDLFNLWTQNTLTVAKEVWYAFVLGVLFNGVWWTCIVAYSVTNKPYSFAVASIITSCFSVVISYFLSIHFSILGAVIGTTLFDFLMMLYILPNSCGLLGMKTREIFTRIKEDYLLIKNRHVK
jgi:O-antigen/teichoic acid export membrane protein